MLYLNRRRIQFWEKKVRRKKNLTASVLREVRIVPPSVFNLSTNYDSTISCLEDLKCATLLKPPANERRKVYIDLTPITDLSITAALVLAAEIDRWRQLKRAPLSPRNPDKWNPKVKNLLIDIGFFDLLGTVAPARADVSDMGGEYSVLKLTSCNTLDRKRIVQIEDDLRGLATALEQESSIYSALTEAAYNCLKHAYPAGCNFRFPPLGKYWWATGSWSPERSEVRIIVYDQGVGIAETLPRWNHWEKIRKQLTKKAKIAGQLLGEHSNMIEAALEVSRTSLTSGHGQGLTDVLAPVEELKGGRVRVLSGRGQVSYSYGSHIEKKEHCQHLGGTLIEWTIPV